MCYSRPTVYAYVPNFVSIGLFCRPMAAKKTQLLPYFRLRHSVVSPVGSNLRKLSTGAQLQTFPYPTVSKSFLYSNTFMAKSGAQTLDVQKRDEQTNRLTNKQTKNSTFLAAPAACKSESHQNWHGDRGPRARSCTSKTSGV